MKTAEEWYQLRKGKIDSGECDRRPSREFYQAIQLDALREAEKVAAKNNDGEMFEDGLSADLHESGIETLPAAYRQGKDDARSEIRDAILARIKEVEG